MNLGQYLIIRGTVLGITVLLIAVALISNIEYNQAFENKLVDNIRDDPSQEQNISTSCQLNHKFPVNILQWCDIITQHATTNNLSPNLIASLIWIESGGQSEAISKSGAVGLMQVMPSDGIAASFKCKNGPCFKDRPTIKQLKNPEFNIKTGTKILARLIERNGSLREGLKSYGPTNYGYRYADQVIKVFKQFQ
jgi:hypothetical protein